MGATDDHLRLIAEALGDVYWRMPIDMSSVQYVSPAYERIWGRSCASLHANPKSFLDATHPDDRARVSDHDRTQPWLHEFRVIRPDGTIRRVRSRGIPLHDASGAVESCVGIVQDITAEHERARLTERLELAARATEDGFWDWDLRTHVSWWSDTFYELFGIDQSTEPSFERWVSHIHPDDRDRVLASFRAALARHDTQWAEEYRYVRGDGQIRDSFDRAYILYDDAGEPTRMGGALMDITERRRLEQQLRHAQRLDAMGQLAGGIAHDFNNVLQAMMIHLQLMRALPDLPAQANRLAADAVGAIERAASLTRQLLVFSRRELVQPRWLLLDDAIAELVRMLHRVLGEHVVLQLALGAHDLRIRADAGMLDQVITNLAINARDAMPGGGTLTIATSVVTPPDRPRCACIVVRDTGVGIADDVLPRIFEPFFSTKEPSRGSGLGLAVVFGIVDQHDGWIDVDSAPAAGTTFRVYLPAGDPPVEVHERTVPKPATRGSETILVVEDDHDVRRVVRELLELEGYRVHEADRAAAALQTFERENGSIDLVVTDLVMPGGMDGTQLAAELERRRPGVRVVFATGYRRDLELHEHQVLLHKPISAAELLGAVRASLDRSS